MTAKRKRHKPEFKAQVALEATPGRPHSSPSKPAKVALRPMRRLWLENSVGFVKY